jgi:hypothetical protein
MNKFERRNVGYAELSKIANTSVCLQYINEVLHINNIPVTDKDFVEMQERMWRALELSALAEKARSE